MELYLRSSVCLVKRTEIISHFNLYLLSSSTAVRVPRGSYNESSAGIYAVSISYSSTGTEVNVQDVTSTLSSCNTDVPQCNTLTNVPCHGILSSVLAVCASTVHICYVSG